MDNGEYKQKDAASAHERKPAEDAAQSVVSDVDASVQSVDLEAEMMKDFDAYFKANAQHSPISQDQSAALEDDVLAEMARYDVPNSDMGDAANRSAIGDDQQNAAALSEPTGQADYSVLKQADGDLLIDDLEQELAQLQRGLTMPVSDQPVQDLSSLTEQMSAALKVSQFQPTSDASVSAEANVDQSSRLFSTPTTLSEGLEVGLGGVQPGSANASSALDADIFNPPSRSGFVEQGSPIEPESPDEAESSSGPESHLMSMTSSVPSAPVADGKMSDTDLLSELSSEMNSETTIFKGSDKAFVASVTPEADTTPLMPLAAQFDVDRAHSDVGLSEEALGEGTLPPDSASVDMSKLVAPTDEVEEVTPFDIPDIEAPIDVHTAHKQADLGLDLELEREFTELLSEKSVPQADIATPDAPAVPLGPIQNAADLDVAVELKNYFANEEGNANLLPELAAASVAQGRPSKINLADTPVNEVAQALNERAPVEEKKSRTPIIAVLALVALGGGGFLFWQSFSPDFNTVEQPIIISADPAAIKQVPANPGGTLVPNQDQAVYDQVEGNDVTVASQSSLVENREEPIDIVQQTLNPDILPSNVARPSEAQLSPSDSTVTSEDQLADPAQPLVMPKKVRTVIVQSDGTIITREIEPSARNSTAPQVDLTAGTNAQAGASGAQDRSVNVDSLRSTIAAQSTSNDGADPVNIGSKVVNSEGAASGSVSVQDNSARVAAAINQAAQQVTQNAIPAPNVPTPSDNPASVSVAGNQADQPSNAPTDLLTAANSASGSTAAPVATQVASNAPQVSSFDGYYMQIASQPSRAAAEATHADLTNQFNTLLDGFNVVYQEAVIEGRGTFHRVRLEIGSRSDAVTLCERFKAAGGSCFVTR